MVSEKRKIYLAQWREKNREKIRAQHKEHYDANKAKIIARSAKWNKENPEAYKAAVKIYFKHSKAKRSANATNWARKQLATNPDFKLRQYLRNRFRNALKSNSKKSSVLNLIGCSIEELRNHLASKFTEGMNWENYGKWHVDHILPCASFDLSKPEEQAKCFHYSNLQPLWELDNKHKSNKITF